MFVCRFRFLRQVCPKFFFVSVLIVVCFRVINNDFWGFTPGLGVLRTVKTLTQCYDRPMVSQIVQKGPFWVLTNYIKASKRFKCHESVTITTQGDFTFLENLSTLVERWEGPISIALYAPGTDFGRTIDSIRYLRHCDSPLIAKFVTFHIFFDGEHTPKQIVKPEEDFFDCGQNPPFRTNSTYKNSKNLLYPINVGRNVARELAQTHFILPLDIELFPNPGFIPKFLSMIARNHPPLNRPNPRVFPLPVFEIESGLKLPNNKTQLRELLTKNLAIPFHKDICFSCHNIPDLQKWTQLNETHNFSVFSVTKRQNEHQHWEPFYVGTNFEPWYDERFSWEGKSDKRVQGYVLCLLDYDFMVLDNAFLVHKPGIKKITRDKKRLKYEKKTNKLIRERFLPEMNFLYNFKNNCKV
ncbi:beta-1,4-glucuronyltransferase 1-like [Tribolium madens]|uniref:beta-1,4-glucuronyltransferase 1-like n=1 Tax=Tribolium madens TaxID=41895 RepID=UPI001CF762C9|nr:beta-1,4-glucuronyltransferase 1-like [Tribolium madens]